METSHEPPEASPWSMPFRLKPGETGRFKLGPLRFWLERRAREWRITTEETGDILARDLSFECPAQDTEIPSPTRGVELRRFVSEATGGGFSLEPRLADRSVVVRPEEPLFLVPGAKAEVFVSSGLWMVLRLEDGTELFERPIVRPSDTWFGPSPLEGELCYASRTSARLDLAEIPQRHHRAVTRILVENRSTTPRRIVRVLLPAPELALYRVSRADAGLTSQLWTQSCELILDDSGVSPLTFRSVPPFAEHATLVAAARRASARNLISRALEAIF